VAGMAPKPDLSIYSSEKIEVEIDGETHRGMRFITGTDELRQEVHFWDLRQIDPKPHRPRDVGAMRRTARVILRDLVAQWKAQEARRPVKVEPHATPQRRRRGG
jgi:hypothetical protein